MTRSLALAVLAVPTLTAAVVALVPPRFVRRVALAGSLPTGVLGVALGVLSVHDLAHPTVGTWLVVDPAGGLLVAVIGVVGFASVLVAPAHLDSSHGSVVREARRERMFFAAFYAFWVVLLAVPLAGNVGAAWLLVEATTAASALLVGFSGKPRALEAAWKYLVLTSLGLGIALLGIVLLAAGVPTGGVDALSWHGLATYSSGREPALVAYLLLLAGLAAKIGWAPVHNWLPDAHSEAPAPVSALLSAALLPAVLLVAWRSQQALAPVVGERTTQTVLICFGLASLLVAVPFLWRPMAWKRLLAYSSLEHMGVIALGIGFATPLAIAGVVVHVGAHAVAKALGFYAATPLLAHDPRSAGHAVTGIGRTQPRLAAAMGLSLGTLAGLPPFPLFVSEALVLAGGFQAGRTWATVVATVLLALGFLGLAHTLIGTIGGKRRRRGLGVPGIRGLTVLTISSTVVLLSLAAVGPWLSRTDLVAALAKGLP